MQRVRGRINTVKLVFVILTVVLAWLVAIPWDGNYLPETSIWRGPVQLLISPSSADRLLGFVTAAVGSILMARLAFRKGLVDDFQFVMGVLLWLSVGLWVAMLAAA
jgi:hypothetical protein